MADTPLRTSDTPIGDRGSEGKTWTPPAGEQGISNRENDDLSVADDEDEDDEDEEFDEDDEEGDDEADPDAEEE